MKFEIKKSRVAIEGVGIVGERYYNTPLSCVFIDRDRGIYHSGLNLTDEGEFIRAPGFGELPKIIEKRIRDFCNAAFEGETKSIAYQSFAHDVLRILDESP